MWKRKTYIDEWGQTKKNPRFWWIKDRWDDFWYYYEGNDVCGPGYASTRYPKRDKLTYFLILIIIGLLIYLAL